MLHLYTSTAISTTNYFCLYFFENHFYYSKHYCHYFCSTPIFPATYTLVVWTTISYINIIGFLYCNFFSNNYYASPIIFYSSKSSLSFVQSM